LPQTRTFLAEIVYAFPLGWSHYVEMLTIDSAEEKSFYEIEAATNQWSVRELQRQIASSLYESVNYFDRHVKLADELPTIGIVLCHRKNDALVELTLPKNANIFASRYELYLPSKEELKTRLEQITRELEGGQP
jgi:exonuclease VII small subunit